MTKHSPAPWTFDEHFCPRRTDYWELFAGDGQIVCQFPEMIPEAVPSTRANAQLIMAAPDMLAALKTVERVLRGEMTNDILVADGTDRTLGEVIRDAIERATELERSAGCSDNAMSKWK